MDQTHEVSDQELDTIRWKAEELSLRILESKWDDSYPVDSVSIAAEMGIDVRYVNFPGRTAGVIIKSPADRFPVIFIDIDVSLERRRFTVAHELGHYVEHVTNHGDRLDDSFQYDLFHVEQQSSRYRFARKTLNAARVPTIGGVPDKRRSEVFADEFAHALLMPSHEVDTFSNLGMSLNEVADYFGVSRVTMSNRLRALQVSL